MGDLDQALENYRRALALAPVPKAYTNIGSIHFARGQFSEAMAAFQKAAELEPRNPLAQRNLGDAYARLGRREDAARAYQAAVGLCEDLLRVNPKDPRTLGRLAVYEAKLGRRTAADRHVSDAIALSPADGDVVYRKAVVEALSGRADAALTSLREAVARGYSAPKPERTTTSRASGATRGSRPPWRRLVEREKDEARTEWTRQGVSQPGSFRRWR